ncbi:MAG: phage portal protein [Leucobacter sp.]
MTSINVKGLTDDENAVANVLLSKLNRKAVRNRLREKLYDGKHSVRQISSVLPPQYANLGIVLGWTASAVDLLSLRCHLDRFTWSGGDLDSLGWREVWDQNMLDVELSPALDSALIQSTSFVSTTRGQDGEPDVLWQFHDALSATGDWNARARKLDSFIVVTDRTENGSPAEFVLYVDDATITCSRSGGWSVDDRAKHSWGVPVDPLPYSRRSGRAFGRSRISRPMIGLQAAAIRELLRLEGHMDIYSYPDFWMLGADPSLFTGVDGLVQEAWTARMGSIKGVPDDPNAPDAATARADVKKFDASSPEPHLAALNALAKLFAREASLPDSSLAITDLANPTSAEAYDASQHDLIAKAEGATDGWSPFLRRSMIRSMAMQDPSIKGVDDIPKEWASVNTDWRDPRFVSRAAEADAGTKQLAAVPWLADTEVALDLIGLTEDQRELALGERRRSGVSRLVEQLRGGGSMVDGAASQPASQSVRERSRSGSGAQSEG